MNKKRMLDNYHKSTGISPYSLLTNINIGYSHPKDNFVFFKSFFSFWVQMIDKRLDLMEPHSNEYADLLSQRFFTFDEYKLVCNEKIKEEEYPRIRVYPFLYIGDSTDNKVFNSQLDTNLSIEQNYVNTIMKWLKHEGSFLFKYFSNLQIPNQLKIEDLKRHVYILAGSGSGKTELLKCIIYELQRKSHKFKNRSIILLDPHGDLALEVLLFCMNSGKNMDRIVYLDPDIRRTAMNVCGKDILKQDYYFSINPLDSTQLSEIDIPSFTEYLSEAFFSIINSTETFQMEVMIESGVETLLRRPESTISDLKVFMDDSQNQKLIQFGSQIPNEEKADFISNKFNDPRLASTKSSIIMRLQKILGNELFKRSFAKKSTVNLEKEMNSGKIIIVNMNKGAMGKSSSNAAGKLLMSLISAYAFKRVRIPKNKRKETFLIADEFQNLISPSIEEILAETRKYSLYGIFANQQMGQNMTPQIKRIVAGNTAIKFMGDNEPESIEWMAKQMKHLSPDVIDSLPPYSFYLNDRFNKKAGSYISRIPKFLLDTHSKYYLNQNQKVELFKYLVEKSGIYKPLSKVKNGEQQNINYFTNKFEE